MGGCHATGPAGGVAAGRALGGSHHGRAPGIFLAPNLTPLNPATLYPNVIPPGNTRGIPSKCEFAIYNTRTYLGLEPPSLW